MHSQSRVQGFPEASPTGLAEEPSGHCTEGTADTEGSGGCRGASSGPVSCHNPHNKAPGQRFQRPACATAPPLLPPAQRVWVAPKTRGLFIPHLPQHFGPTHWGTAHIAQDQAGCTLGNKVLTRWKGIKHLQGESKMKATARLGGRTGREPPRASGPHSRSCCLPPISSKESNGGQRLQRVEEAAGSQGTLGLGPGNAGGGGGRRSRRL